MKKNNRGFSIAEVVISIAVVLIVTFGTITLVQSSRIRTNEDYACTVARTYASDALELFKLYSNNTDNTDYKTALENHTEIKPENEKENVYIYDGGACTLTITVDFVGKKFTAKGITKKGKTFLEVKYDKNS